VCRLLTDIQRSGGHVVDDNILAWSLNSTIHYYSMVNRVAIVFYLLENKKNRKCNLLAHYTRQQIDKKVGIHI
jgi:hypothetical protein